MINYILFDVDNTLYPASSGIGTEMIRRMNIFTAQFLSVSAEEAAEMRRDRETSVYHSTLEWLVKKHNLKDTESFFTFIHPDDLKNYFGVNPALINMLNNLDIRSSVLTNSTIEHAANVTDYLSVTHFFENIFDIKFNTFTGKPHKSAYENVLKNIGRDAENVLFIDDIPSYLNTFKTMGGNCLLVDEGSNYPDSGFPTIKEITELEKYLENMR